MAENTTANFEEVLSLKVDEGGFEKSLARAKLIWEKFTKDVGNEGAQLAGGISGGDIEKSIQKLGSLLQEFAADSIKANKEVADSQKALIEKVEQLAEESTRKRVAREKKAAAEIANLNEVASKQLQKQLDAKLNRPAGSIVQFNPDERKALDFRIESQGADDRLLAEQEQLAERRRRLEIFYQELFDKIEARRVKEQAAAERARAKQEKADRKEEEDLRRRELLYQRLWEQAERRRQREIKALEREQKAVQKAIDDRRKTELMYRDMFDSIAAKEAKIEKRDSLDLQKSVEALDTSAKKIASANRNLDLVGATSTQQRIDLLRQSLAKLRSELNSVQSRSQSLTPGTAESNNAIAKLQGREASILRDIASQEKALIREQNSLLKEKLGIQRSINGAQKESKGFIQRITDDLSKSVASVVKFYGIWQALQAVTSAVGAAITAPFKALAEGVKYIQQTEKQAEDLVGVLTGSVKFSDDLVENFELARDAALQITEALQDRAARSGVPQDMIEQAFKSFESSGAQQFVKGFKETIDLAELFTLSIRSVAGGALEVQSEIGKIPQILTGNIKSTDKWALALGVTGDQWADIIKEARQGRNLMDLIADKSEKFRKQMDAAGKGQLVLAGQLRLLFDRVAASGARELFDKITETIKVLIEYLKANGPKIASILAGISNLLLSIADTLDRIAQSPLFNNAFLQALNYLLVGMVGAMQVLFTDMVDLLSLLPKAAQAASKMMTDPVRATSELVIVGKEASDRFTKNWLDAEKTIKGLNGELDLTKTKQKDLLNVPFPGLRSPAPGANILGNVSAEFGEAKAKFLQELDEIKDAYQEFQGTIDAAVVAGKLTQQEASEAIVKAQQREVVQINAKTAAFMEQAKQFKGRLLSEESGASGLDRDRAGKQFDAGLIQLEREIARRIRQINKDSASERIKAEREVQAIIKQQIENTLSLRKAEADGELELVRAAVQERLLLAYQEQQASNDLFEQNVREQRKGLEAEVNQYEANNEKKIAAIGKLQQFETSVQYEREVRSRNLQELFRQELERVLAYNQAVRAQALEARTLASQINQMLSPSVRFDDRIKAQLDDQQRVLEALQKETRYRLQVAEALGQQGEAVDALRLQLGQLQNDSLRLIQERLDAVSIGIGSDAVRRIRQRQVLEGQRDALQQRQNQAADQLSTSQIRNTGVEAIDQTFAKIRTALGLEIADLGKQIQNLNRALRTGTSGIKDTLRNIADGILGTGVIDVFRRTAAAGEKAATNTDKAAAGLIAAGNVASRIQNAISNFESGRQQGGLLGGIGAVAQGLGDIPVVGQYIAAAGQILSLVGNLFTRSARKVAEEIKKSFEKTMQAFQSGNATLVDTIAALEKQRTDAIIRLSGKKGGKSELETLLPEFDNQINSLKKQQEEILSNFDNQLLTLRLQNDVLSSALQQWEGINEQVKEYIDAGGDAAKAAEFLSLSLAKIRQDAVDELAEGEQDAVQSAIRLNDLLQDRLKLVEDFAKKEFDIINGSALERQQSNAVVKGRELADARKQYQEQLAAIDAEVKRVTLRVDKEREIFNLATEISDLRRRDEELTLSALERQLERFRSLKDLIGSIIPNGSGGFGVSPGSVLSIGNISITVNTGLGSSGQQIGKEIFDSLSDELSRQYRLAPTY